jgi:hypothetical protein
VGSTNRSVTASQSMGFARPPFTRSAAFFFACASTKRSSSATQASSAAFAVFAGRFAGLSCALESAERFAGIVAEGAARWGKLLRSFRHGGGFRDAIIASPGAVGAISGLSRNLWLALDARVTYPRTCMSLDPCYLASAFHQRTPRTRYHINDRTPCPSYLPP